MALNYVGHYFEFRLLDCQRSARVVVDIRQRQRRTAYGHCAEFALLRGKALRLEKRRLIVIIKRVYGQEIFQIETARLVWNRWHEILDLNWRQLMRHRRESRINGIGDPRFRRSRRNVR